MNVVEGLIMPLLILPGIFLYPIAFFTIHWVSDSRCDEVGLFYKCCTAAQDDTHNSTNLTAFTTSSILMVTFDNFTSNITNSVSNMEGSRSCGYAGRNALDVRVLGLQATSTAFCFMIVLEGILSFLAEFNCDDVCGYISHMIKRFLKLASESEDSGLKSVLLLSGILSFAGCMLIVKNYERNQLGYSFYVCLVPASIMMSIIGLSVIVSCCSGLFIICCNSTDSNTSGSTKENDQESGIKDEGENAKSVELSSDDVAVEMKGANNQILASDEACDDDEKLPTNKDIHNMSDQDTTTVIVQPAKSSSETADSSGFDVGDGGQEPGNAVEGNQNVGQSHEKKSGTSMIESLAKLNVKNLFVLSFGSLHCVCLSKKDETTQM